MTEQFDEGLSDVPPLCLTPSHPVCAPRGNGKCQDAAHNALLSGLRQLRTNHTSGAKELATQAVATLVRIAAIASSGMDHDGSTLPGSDKSSASQIWWETTRRAAWAIVRYGRPSMGAAITTAVVNLMDRTRQEMPSDVPQHSKMNDGDVVHSAVSKMQEYLQQRSREQRSMVGVQLRNFILQNFQHKVDEFGKLGLKMLTLSSSSTIRLGLMTLLEIDSEQGGNLAICLRIMESRPLCEGADLARQLVEFASAKGLEKKLTIEIASDASAAILSRGADLVLLGADRISSDGDVSNKTGSVPAVLSAKMVSKGVSVAAVTELEKIAKPGRIEEHGEEDNDIGELVSLWRGKLGEASQAPLEQTVTVRNIYFEWVPAESIDYYICESGLLSVDSIREQSYMAVRTEERLFGDLDDAAAVVHA